MMLAEWNWIVGRVVAPFGRLGEVKVQLETDFPDRFGGLKEVCLRPPKFAPRRLKVERARLHKGQALLKLEGIESIDDAELWRGALVQIRRTEAVELPADNYYVADLVGAEVLTRDGRVIGKLDRVLPYPAQDLFQIGDALIPAVKEFIVSIDLANRRIVVDPPDGLLPGEAPETDDAD